jgi:hypothetical protein
LTLGLAVRKTAGHGFSAVWVFAILTQMAPFKAVVTLPRFNHLTFSFRRTVGLLCFNSLAFALAIACLALAFALLAFSSFASVASFAIDGVQGVAVGGIGLGNGS